MSLALVVVVCSFLAQPANGMPPPEAIRQAQDAQSQTSPDTPPQPAPQQPDQASPTTNSPSQAPQDKTSEEPAKPATPQADQPAPAPEQPAKPAENQSSQPKKIAKKKPAAKSKTTHAKTKPSNASLTADAPNKTVVKNGSTTEPKVQIAPSISPQQASDQRQGTSDLLASTDENLKKIDAKSLPSTQQDMIQQIKKYMQQSKEATSAGDLDRAHNLAVKASLLAEELAKP